MSKTKSTKKMKSKNTKRKTTNRPNGRTKNQKVQTRKLYKSPKFWAIISVICIVLASAITISVINGQQHGAAISAYKEAWDGYADVQYDLGQNFGSMLGEMGFSTDGSTKYNVSYSEQRNISEQCAKKLGIYDAMYNNPYATENKDISKKNTSYIKKSTEKLKEYTSIINNAKTAVEDCREIGEAKKKEIDEEIARKEAEEKAKADEAAEKQRQQEEARAAYARNKLTYDKFANQIFEGMSLSTIKEIYGSFDTECEISSQSGGYVIYTCSSSSYSNFWAAVFSFYNGVLRSKSQTGLK